MHSGAATGLSILMMSKEHWGETDPHLDLGARKFQKVHSPPSNKTTAMHEPITPTYMVKAITTINK